MGQNTMPVDALAAALEVAQRRGPAGDAMRDVILSLYDGYRYPLNLAKARAALCERNAMIAGWLVMDYLEYGETPDLRAAVASFPRRGIPLPDGPTTGKPRAPMVAIGGTDARRT